VNSDSHKQEHTEVHEPALPGPSSFFEQTRKAKKVMVLDLGFLGDTVHTLPSLWTIRQAYPEAELHMAVAEHVTSLMECLPWLNRTWGYARFPKHATLRQNFQMVARLRKERFDVLINLNGSDRSSWLSFLSGARFRLGRLPRDGGPPLWRKLFTHVVAYSSNHEPSYVQKWKALQQAGFAGTEPEFHIEINQAHLQAAGLTKGDVGTYIHLSPFTTADNKELPPEQLLELIVHLQNDFHDKRLVISCSPTERERAKMKILMSGLRAVPWKIFAGELNLVQLAAVIQNSAAHLCGDTGTLHLSLMTGTPAVSWFRPNPGMRAWIPAGGQYMTLAGTIEPDGKYLAGVEITEIVRAVRSVISMPRKTSEVPFNNARFVSEIAPV